MGSRGVHGVRTTRQTPEVEIVKLFDGCAEPIRRTAHFIQRQQAIINIQRGIFRAFGHQRPGQLLEVHDKVRPAVSLLVGGVIGKIEKQKTADVIQFEKQARVGFLGALDRRRQVVSILGAK